MTQSRTCPICKRPLDTGDEGERVRPFCSKRCADIDLGHWLMGSYTIPAVESEGETEDEDGGNEGDSGILRH
ncbi:MAG TPA: DNA gyrase inhibitor YacG [Micropepsaceae bacterium]